MALCTVDVDGVCGICLKPLRNTIIVIIIRGTKITEFTFIISFPFLKSILFIFLKKNVLFVVQTLVIYRLFD